MSVCPHMSRNFVSVCPHMSRIFVSVCPHMSRNFMSVCPHMSRNVAHIYVYSFSVPVSQIVRIFDVPVSQQPDFVQKLCLFGLFMFTFCKEYITNVQIHLIDLRHTLLCCRMILVTRTTELFYKYVILQSQNDIFHSSGTHVDYKKLKVSPDISVQFLLANLQSQYNYCVNFLLFNLYQLTSNNSYCIEEQYFYMILS